MNPPNSTFAVLLGLALLAALAAGAYLFFQDIYQLLQTLDRQVAAGIVAGLVAALYIGLSIRRAGQVSGLQQLRLSRKSESYARFLAAASRMPPEQDDGTRSEAAPSKVEAATGDLLLWAGTGVIKQLVAYRRANPRMVLSDPTSHSNLENLLRAMRTDLGENNVGLGEKDLANLLTPAGVNSSERSNR